MRGILVSLFIFGTLPFIFMRPFVGLLVYSWISFMSPHRLAYGFAYDFPFAMLVGGVFVFSWLMSREPKLPPLNAVVVLTICLTLWMTVTTFFALKGDFGQVGHWIWWERVMKIMLITLVAMAIISNRKRVDAFIWIMVLSIGFFAIRGGIFTITQGAQFIVYGPAGSMIEENNALGVATIMIVPLVRYLHLQATNKYIRRALLAAIPILVLSAIGSQSRGALLAMSAMGAFMLLKSKHKIAAGSAMMVMVVAGLSFMPQQWYDRMSTIKNYEQDASAMTRINAWTMGFNLALDRPFVGGGFRVYNYLPYVWEKYAPDPNLRAAAHSNYFQVLGNHGFPGLFMYLGILFLTFRYSGWLIKRTRDRPDLRWANEMGAMCQVALVGYAVGGAFLNLAYYDLYWGIVALTVAARYIVATQLAKPEETKLVEAPAAPAEVVPVTSHKSYLRGSGQSADQDGFLRN